MSITLKTSSCSQCGASFDYESKGGRKRLFCSDDCIKARKRDDARAKYALSPPPKPPKPRCVNCDMEMVARRDDRRYCGSPACQAARRDAAYAALEASKAPRPQCRNCGAEMQRRATNVYCDAPACRTAKYYATLAAKPPCSVDMCDKGAIAKGLCGGHYRMEWGRANPSRSQEHYRSRRARLRGARVEHVDFSVVLERDGWACGLCGDVIPRDAVWPDRMSASLDHVVPLSRGGEHSMANVQASHLGCNSRKGNRVEAAVAAV